MKVTKIALIIAAIAAIVVGTNGFAASKTTIASRRSARQSGMPRTTAKAKKIAASEQKNTEEVGVAAVAPTVTDAVAATQEDIIKKATAQTELIKKSAMDEMNKARRQVIEGTIEPDQAAKIISQQNAIIAEAKQGLKNTIERAVEQVDVSDEEQGYLEYLVSGAQSLGQRALAPFKAGYGYTDEEKAVAQRMIKGFNKQKEEIERDYEVAQKKEKAPAKRAELQERYEAIISQLDEQIYQQELIVGQKWSTQRKLFWAAVGAGAVAAGATLGGQYLNSLEEFAKTKGAEELAAKQEAGAAMVAAKEQERALEKAVESMEEQYVTRTAGEAMVAAKAEERAREKAFETMEEQYESAVTAGQAMITAKAEERALEKATEDMEEAYVQEVQAAGQAMQAAKEQERALERATEEMEEKYIEEVQAAGQAMEDLKAEEKALEKATEKMEEKYLQREAEIAKIREEATLAAEKKAAEQLEQERQINEQLMAAQEKAKEQLIAENLAAQKEAREAQLEAEQAKQRALQLEDEAKNAREEAEARKKDTEKVIEEAQDQAALEKAAQEQQLAEEKARQAEAEAQIAAAEAEKAAEEQRKIEAEALAKQAEEDKLTEQLTEQRALEAEYLSGPAKVEFRKAFEKTPLMYEMRLEEEAALSDELGALVRQQKELEDKLADIDIKKEKNEESWGEWWSEAESKPLIKKIEELQKQKMDKALQIVQVEEEIGQTPWLTKKQFEFKQARSEAASQKDILKPSSGAVISTEDKAKATAKRAEEIMKQRESAEAQRRIDAQKKKVEQKIEEEKLRKLIEKQEREAEKKAKEDLAQAQKAERQRQADLKKEARDLRVERRKAENANDKDAVKKINEQLKVIEDDLAGKPKKQTESFGFEQMMEGI